MSIHLIKLSVGSDTLSDLIDWQEQRIRMQKRSGKKPELIHVTRHMPKRAEELLAGGSIYWVIKGWVIARQKLLDFRPLIRDGVPYCGIVYDTEMIRVRPQPRRPFQGWRYFDGKEVPADLSQRETAADLPEEMLQELSELGLL